MENIALLIAAVFGTTGIASLANYITLSGRKSRLNKSLAQLSASMNLMAENSKERLACEYSFSVQALELASLNLIKMKTLTLWIINISVGSIALGVLAGLIRDIFANTWSWNEITELLTSTSWVTAMVTFGAVVVIQLVASQFYLSYKRSQFISETWNKEAITKELIRQYSGYLDVGQSADSSGSFASNSAPSNGQ